MSVYSSLAERLLCLSVLDPISECWVWIGRRDPKGYGRFCQRVTGRSHPVPFYAHRVSYEIFRGVAIPVGFQLDHQCRSPWCINPMHLEPVPAITNRERQMLNYYDDRPEPRLWLPEKLYEIELNCG